MRVVGRRARSTRRKSGRACDSIAQHGRAVLDEVAGRDRTRRARAELQDVRTRPRRPGPPACSAAVDRGGRGPGRGRRRWRARSRTTRGTAASPTGRRSRGPRAGRTGVDLPRRVARGEHQVGLARDVVELLHRVTGEVRGRPSASIAARSSSVAVSCENVVPVAVRERVASRPSSATRRVSVVEARDARLAAAEAERHPPVEGRPDLARATDVGAPPPAAVLRLREAGRRRPCSTTSTTSCIDTSTCWGRPVASAVSAANATSGPTWRVAGRLGAAHRRAVGIAGRVHVPARGHDAEVGCAPGGTRARRAERRDVDPHRVGRPPGIDVEHAREAGGREHDVGGGEEHVEFGVAGAGDAHRPLARGSTP